MQGEEKISRELLNAYAISDNKSSDDARHVLTITWRVKTNNLIVRIDSVTSIRKPNAKFTLFVRPNNHTL